jgi:hypothetical protein
MGAKGDALAKQFETKIQDAIAVVERLGDAEWSKVTAGEKWTVGVTAHHVATSLEAVSGLVKALGSGQSTGNLSMAMLDQMNAQHAKDHASCTRAETIALLRKGAVTAATTIRGLSDDQLARTATVLSDAPPMSTEQLIHLGLVQHVGDHFGSIRKTIDSQEKTAGR